MGDILEISPPIQIWRGGDAWLIWFLRRFTPFTFLDANMSKMEALDAVSKKLAEQKELKKKRISDLDFCIRAFFQPFLRSRSLLRGFLFVINTARWKKKPSCQST